MNFFDLVEYQSRTRPHAPALLEPDRAIGYLELAGLVRAAAGALRRRGVAPSDRVGVMLGNSGLHLIVLLALARLGAVAVSIAPNKPLDALQDFARRFGPRALLGLAPDMAPQMAIEGVAYWAAGPWLSEAADAAEAALPNASGGDRLMKLALSSGTTGVQKATAWTHARMIEQLQLQRSVRPFGPGVRLLPLMGFDAAVACDAALRQLCAGGAVIASRGIGYDALCRAVDHLGATHVLTSPGIAGRLLERMPAERLRFPDLAGLRLTGGLVSPSLRHSLLRRVAPHISVDYGASEVGPLATGDAELFERAPHAVGRIVPWALAEAVDDQGQALPPGRPGRLRFRSQSCPPDYVGDGGALLREGWFYPGDVGYIDAEGLLVVEAREDDLLNVGGVKILPTEVEAVLALYPGVIEAAAYGVQSPAGKTVLIGAVVLEGSLDEAALMRHCQQRLGQRSPTRLLQLDRLPRNAMGKLLRRELVARTRVSA